MGLALAQAQSWRAKRADELPGVDREFIDLSATADPPGIHGSIAEVSARSVVVEI
jgi:hypothetical protein